MISNVDQGVPIGAPLLPVYLLNYLWQVGREFR